MNLKRGKFVLWLLVLVSNILQVKSEDGSSATPRRSSSSNALDEESFEIEEWFGTLTDILLR